MITSHILTKTDLLKPEPEVTPNPPGFEMFNTGGTEVEVAEWLYSMVRMCKPERILETGTHLGVSSAFMGLALQKNNKGKITTLEVIRPLQEKAEALWRDLSVTNRIEGLLQASLDYKPPERLQMLFLDSEPHLRFSEFNRFWPYLDERGFIIIHDLDERFGHHGTEINGVYDWPYGDFREKLSKYFNEHLVQVVHFPTPRGLTMLQKVSPHTEGVKLMRGDNG